MKDIFIDHPEILKEFNGADGARIASNLFGGLTLATIVLGTAVILTPDEPSNGFQIDLVTNRELGS